MHSEESTSSTEASSGIDSIDGVCEVFRLIGFGSANVGGEIWEKTCGPKVGEEVVELEAEVDISSEDAEAKDLGDVGDAGGDDEEDDSRRWTVACWACNAIYCCSMAPYIQCHFTSAVSLAVYKRKLVSEIPDKLRHGWRMAKLG